MDIRLAEADLDPVQSDFLGHGKCLKTLSLLNRRVKGGDPKALLGKPDLAPSIQGVTEH
jgi:hypothetical protein